MEFIIKQGYIYSITSPSGRVYIGKTFNLSQRLNKYKNLHCKEQPKLYRSIMKYGWNNHTTNVLVKLENTSLEHLNKEEKFYIEKYNSFSNGLNCTKGGDGIIGYKHSKTVVEGMSSRRKNKPSLFKGRKHTKEAKDKISKINTGRIHTESTRIKISNSKKGKKLKGKCLENLLQYRKNTSRKVRNTINNTLYSSAKEAYKTENFIFTEMHFRRMLRNESTNHTNYVYEC